MPSARWKKTRAASIGCCPSPPFVPTRGELPVELGYLAAFHMPKPGPHEALAHLDLYRPFSLNRFNCTINKDDPRGINVRIRHVSWRICTPAPTQENDGRLP